MTKILLISILMFSVAVLAGKAGKVTTKDESSAGFKLINVTDLDKMLSAEKGKIHLFDANTDKTRIEEGMIPGAITLDTVSQYDVTKTLPADHAAKIVFYCANTKCQASHDAARRAVSNGYKNVSVMADGIQGWKKAGKPTEKFSKKGA